MKTSKKLITIGILILMIVGTIFLFSTNSTVSTKGITKRYVIEAGNPIPNKWDGLVKSDILFDGKNHIPNQEDIQIMKNNTINFQRMVDEASATNGIINLPAGNFYFYAKGTTQNGVFTPEIRRGDFSHVILCKDNVTIIGAGKNQTFLRPYGHGAKEHNRGGLDMFYYNDYGELSDKEGLNAVGRGKFLKNNVFRDFTIDGSQAVGDHYTSAGKGFMINLFEDCHFDNIDVYNTDGTGFGIDCPINSTITNCYAQNCGKIAKPTDGGASGFGIGTGYSNKENIRISNCRAIGNKKFGFFFEHQSRFTEIYQATDANGFIVENCVARDNLYDFGGAKANDVTYFNCNRESRGPNLGGIFFEINGGNRLLSSFDVDILNCSIAQKFEDGREPAFDWAKQRGISNGVSRTSVSPDAIISRAEFMTLLWRWATQPGDVSTRLDGAIDTGASDIVPTNVYAAPFKWGIDNRIVTLSPESENKARPLDQAMRIEVLAMLYKYSESPIVGTKNSYPDCGADQWLYPIVNWAIENNIIADSINGELLNPTERITRKEAIEYLYRFDKNAKTKFHVSYYLDGGSFNQYVNESYYTDRGEGFSIPNPTKPGYIFEGWTGTNGTTPQKNIAIGDYERGNKTYIANWKKESAKHTVTIFHYREGLDGIYYDGTNGNIDEGEIHQYDVEEGTNFLPPLMDYVGFEKPTNPTPIKVSKDITLKYYYPRKEYSVSVKINKGIDSVQNVKKYKFGHHVELVAVLKDGYENPKWSGDFKNSKFNMPAKNVNLAVEATPIKYKIDYNLSGGTSNGNPTEYTVESSDITLKEPTKSKSVFRGWIGTGLPDATEKVVIPKGSTGNRTYIATWTEMGEPPVKNECKVKVYYYIQKTDGRYTDGTEGTADIPDFVDELSANRGEKFTVFPRDLGPGFAERKEKEIVLDIPQDAATFDLKLKCGRMQYGIGVMKGEGIESVNVKEYYFYEEHVNLTAKCLPGYQNPTWSGYTNSNTFTMPSEPIIMKVQADIINYKIKYNLDGGVFLNVTNPSTYTISTQDIKLNNPSKEGYDFVGWKDKDGNVSNEVIIKKGSTGDKEYTAQWSKRDLTKAKVTVQHFKQNINKTYSDIPFEQEDIYVTIGDYFAPTYKDYEGFTKPAPMDKLQIGDDVIILCKYTRNKYKLNTTIGEGIINTDAKNEYMYEEKVLINPQEKEGYEKPYVTGDVNSLEFSMPAKDTNITVNANPITYKINIKLNNGYFEQEVPREYNIKSEDIVIPAPKKDNCEFLGWTYQAPKVLNKEFVIPKGSTGDIYIEANWKNLTNDVHYDVQHFKQNIDGTYNDVPDEKEDFQGKKGDNVSIIAKNYDGFTAPDQIDDVLENDKSYLLRYFRNTYNVTITKGEGIESFEGNQEYKFDQEVKVNAKALPGYNTITWSGDYDVDTFNMPAKNVKLNVKANIINYAITYDLAGGTVDGNPTEFTVNSEDIKLINPTKEGYDFIGWTSVDYTTPQMEMIIKKGTTKDLKFKANWKVKETEIPDPDPNPDKPEIVEFTYRIEHYKENINGTYGDEPDEYFEGKAKKDSEVLARVKKYKGFTAPKEEKVVLDNDKIIKYYYTRNSYNLNIKFNDGIEEVIAKKSYKYDEKVIIECNSKIGYTDPAVKGDFDKLEFIMPDKDVDLNIVAFLRKYSISYDLQGGFAFGNPKEYTVESNDIVLNNPTRGNVKFLGWADESGRNLGTYVVIPKGSIGNKYFRALWQENEIPPTIVTTVTYTVEHYKQNPDGSYNETPSQTERKSAVKGAKVRPGVKNYPGYTSPQIQEVVAEKGLVVKYQYEIKKYTVNLEIGKGIKDTSDNKQFKAGEEVELSVELLEGYENPTWTGDYNTNEFIMPSNDVNMKVYATPIEYKITYNLDGGKLSEKNPSTYTIESEDISLNKPTKENYRFVGWQENDSSQTIENVVIQKGNIGDKAFTAIWEKYSNVVNYEVRHYKEKLDGTYEDYNPDDVDYLQADSGDEVEPSTKIYEGFKSPEIQKVVLDEKTVVKYYYARKSYNVKVDKGTGIKEVSGDGEYKFEEDVTLSAKHKEGYDDISWSGDFKDNMFKMPSKNVLVFVKANPIDYEITYDLDGGKLNYNNPSKYNIESNDIKLNNPTKEGYDFVGWKDLDTDEVSDETIITSGSIGDKSYVAIWKEKEVKKYEYVVKYVKEGLDGKFDENNPDDIEKYKVEDGTRVTPEVKKYEGFNAPDAKEIVVDQDLTLIYKYTRKSYNLNVKYGKGIKGINNSKRYKYDEKIKLDFDFEKGYGDVKISGDFTKDEFNMPAKDVNVYAEASIVKYMIDYKLNGGKLNKSNPTEYTIESDDIKLNNPVKQGFKFVGWYEEGDDFVSDSYVIKKGSTGDKTFVAKWTNIDGKPDDNDDDNENDNNKPSDKPGNNDNNNNNNKPENNDNENTKPNNKPNNKPDNNDKGDDLADKDIPHAGKSVAIVILISIASAIGIIKFVDYNRYRKY